MNIAQQQQLLQAAAATGWRISPLATAVALSARDPKPYLPYKHLRLLSDVIRRAVTKGERWIISMPPQNGKSWTVSKWTPAWFLENWPHLEVINCGYGKGFAQEWGRLVRNLIQTHPQFSVKLSQDSQAADRWHTDQGGGMLCAGIGSGITGKGSDLLLIDDPVKSWEEATSFTYREKVWNWYLSEARTRVHQRTAIIVVMTRWNEDDLAGRLLKYHGHEGWQVLNLPAIYDETAQDIGPDPLGRQLGEPLCPELHDLEDLRMHMMNSAEVWESLHQGRPGTTAGLGNVYKVFDERRNMRPIDRDPNLRLFWSLDFNVDPMCSVIGQYKEYTPAGVQAWNAHERFAIVDILDEVCLPDSSTAEACDEFLVRAKALCGNFSTRLEIYGDPAGKSRHTSQVAGSDWDIIRNFFKGKSQFDVKINVKSKAPAIKDRVNAVNGMLRNALGETHLYIDPRCRALKRDLLNVKWKRDVSGNTTGQLEKSQPDLTHVSDALGYAIETMFGRLTTVGGVAGVMR